MVQGSASSEHGGEQRTEDDGEAVTSELKIMENEI